MRRHLVGNCRPVQNSLSKPHCSETQVQKRKSKLTSKAQQKSRSKVSYPVKELLICSEREGSGVGGGKIQILKHTLVVGREGQGTSAPAGTRLGGALQHKSHHCQNFQELVRFLCVLKIQWRGCVCGLRVSLAGKRSQSWCQMFTWGTRRTKVPFTEMGKLFGEWSYETWSGTIFLSMLNLHVMIKSF